MSFKQYKYILKIFLIGILSVLLLGCVYRMDIQQGNLLEEARLEQVEIGMTRSQVQFLLGTPMVSDSFHHDRWDYTYYMQHGRSPEIDRRWFIVFFEGDAVIRLERNAILLPTSN